MDIGHSIGPLATGIIIGAFSFFAGFGVAAILLMIGAVMFWILMRGPIATKA
jgi:dipeptide/tripeptide permease